MIIEKVSVSSIHVPDRLRAHDSTRVSSLAESMRSIGLRTPISIRIAPEMEQDGEMVSDVPVLVAGRHRLEAARVLGFDDIDVIVIPGTETDARLWEIAENLHRAELSVQERADHIAEWIKLTEKKLSGDKGVSGQDVPKLKTVANPKGVGRPEGGIAAASRELGIHEKEAQRSIKIASIPSDARKAADDAGITSQSARLEIAKAPDPVEKVREIAERASKPAPAIKNALESEEDWRRALFTVWNRGAQDWRDRALETMDAPVFDRTAAGGYR